MGGVAVLNPHDCLQNPFKPPRNINPISLSNRVDGRTTQRHRRKWSSNSSPPSRSPVGSPPKNLIMGQVKILKRGEELKEITRVKTNPTRSDLDLGTTQRLGPEPQMVSSEIRLVESKRTNGFYAGNSFMINSPPPSSLPLPSRRIKGNGVETKKDDATNDLCRILGLSL